MTTDPTPWELSRRLDKQDTVLDRIELKIDRIGAVEARLDSQDARMSRIEKTLENHAASWPTWIAALSAVAAVVVGVVLR